jgi:hypothetical protein
MYTHVDEESDERLVVNVMSILMFWKGFQVCRVGELPVDVSED